MPVRVEPVVGQWYLHHDKGEMFQVVAIDTRRGCIEIQSCGGDIEEIDRDVWMEMDIEAAPEDWTGPFDDLARDSFGLADTLPAEPDWRRQLESIEAANEPWMDAEVLE